MTFIVPAINTFDAGTSGATVALETSGGANGDGFTNVSVGSGATCSYDNTRAAHGTNSLKLATGVSAVSPFVAWNHGRIAKLGTSYVRFYVYITAYPSTLHRFFTAVGAASTRCSISLNTTGTLRLANNVGGVVGTTTTPLPLNTWVRVEAKIVGDAAAGQIVLRYYTTKDSTTVTEEIATATNINTGGIVDDWRFGITSSVASVTAFWMDELGVGAEDWLGPYDPGYRALGDEVWFADTHLAEPGVPDRVALFDGVNQRVRIPNHAAWSIPTSAAGLTVSFLFCPHSLVMLDAEAGGAPQRDYVYMAGKGDTYGVSGNQEWGCRMYQRLNSENRDNRCSGYCFNAPGGLGIGSYFQDKMFPGNWIMYTLVFDASGEGTMAIYKDGVKRDEDLYDQSATFVEVDPHVSTAPVYIGTMNLDSFFEGAIARFVIFSKRLSDSEVAALQTARLAGTLDAQIMSTGDVAGFWKLNDPDGATVALDSSGNGRHGAYFKPNVSQVPGFLGASLATISTTVTRAWYGDDSASYTQLVGAGAHALFDGGRTLTFWSAQTGGGQYTDLLTATGGAISEVVTSDGTDGRITGALPSFQGPPNILGMWADRGDGSPRVWIQARTAVQYLMERIAALP